MRTDTEFKLYGAVISSEEGGGNFALVLAATAEEAFTRVGALAPKQSSVEILPAEELLWTQYRGFAVLTSNGL